MILSVRNIIIYMCTILFLVFSLILLFKTKKDYRNYQKRTKCTSALCLLSHELYVGLACYCAWYGIWPFSIHDSNLYIHYILFFIGIFPSLFGLILYLLYLMGMKSFPRAIGLNPDKLITDGIYKISRNPQSIGRGIGLIGIGIMGRSLFTLFLAILWILINHFNILIEEQYLEVKFGESYLQYCMLTPRYCRIYRKKKKSLNINQIKIIVDYK